MNGDDVTVVEPGRKEGAQIGAARTVADLERLVSESVAALAGHSDPQAFQALLRISALVGESLGISARTLAATGSWAKVADVAGTSRQAAWSRWSG